MNAIQFIKEHGVEKAREVVNVAPDRAITVKPSLDFKHFMYGICENAAGAYILLSDLKRLVESVDLVGKYRSIDHAKNHYNNMREALNQYQYENKDIEDLSNELEKSIADYQSIYCVADMGDDTHIENHMSPNCKVGGEVMKSEVDKLKLFAIADILSVSRKQKTTETINMHINTIIDIAFLKGQQAQQSKVDELQKRVDASSKVLESIRKEIKHGHLSDDESQTLSSYANDLEQALKGEKQ